MACVLSHNPFEEFWELCRHHFQAVLKIVGIAVVVLY